MPKCTTLSAGMLVLALISLTACYADNGPSLDPLVSAQHGDTSLPAPQNGPVLAPGTAADGQPRQVPLISKGSGQFIAPQFPPPATPGGTSGDLFDFSGMSEDGDAGTTLNFVDTDIKEVIKSILGDRFGFNYVIDPSLVARLTLKTNDPLTQETILPVLEQALSLNGIAMVRRGDGYSIEPADRVQNAPLAASSRMPGFATEVIALHHVSAAEVAKILKEYSQSSAVRVVDDVRGIILLAGSAPERQKLTEIVHLFDVDELAGMSFGLFQVDAASPRVLIAELKVILTTDGLESGGVLKFMAIDRLRSILAIASDPQDIDQVQIWLNRLDRDTASTQPQLYVHYVEHGEAKEVAETLSAIFGVAAEDEGYKQDEARAYNRGDVAPAYKPAKIGYAQGRDTDTDSAYQNNSVPPPDSAYADGNPAQKYADQNNYDASSHGIDYGYSENTPADAAKSYGYAGNMPSVRITADEQNNALYILATPKDYRMIEAALDRIDVAPLQVLIEATIAEVSLTDDLKYGVEYFFENNQSAFALVGNTLGVPTAIFPGFSYALNLANARIVLNALEKVTNVKVISAPQLMVMDNHTARLQVGDQVPIIKQTAVSVADPDAPIVNSVELLDTGVILSVTPRVNSSGEVQLEIEQEVSDVVATTTSTIDSPTIQQRRIKSAVVVQDGKTIALGGLIRDRNTIGISGLPVLAKIPLLGALFGATSDTVTRTELLVLITPHVVRNAHEADQVTRELKDGLKGLNSFRQKSVDSTPAAQTPVLPVN